jgi:hypothetical protein
MRYARTSLIAALFGLALTPVAASAEEQHHQPEPMMMMPMMNMMGQQPGGMPMMEMMGQGGMGMMGQGPMPMMMGMGDHLEGRIAFLRAELGITEAQAPAWDRFAQALREGAAGAKQLATAYQAAMGSSDVLQRLEQEEQRLGARLKAVKAIRAAFAELQAVLSADQKSTAEALFTRPVCFGAMGVL